MTSKFACARVIFEIAVNKSARVMDGEEGPGLLPG